MKDGKVQSQDDVPIKLPEQRQLLSILMKLWKTGGQPDFQKRSMYIPEPKKEYRKKTYNYKSISSILHGSTVIILERIQRLNEQLGILMWTGMTYTWKRHKGQTSRPWWVMFKYLSNHLSCLLTSLKHLIQWEMIGYSWWYLKWVFYHS